MTSDDKSLFSNLGEETHDAAVKIWRSEELLGGKREAIIEHRGSRYYLMVTKAGKLILNK